MSPPHYLRAALLARRLRSRGLTVERRGCSLRIVGDRAGWVSIRVYRGGRPLVGIVRLRRFEEHLFADSPAELASTAASYLLPSPTGGRGRSVTTTRHRAHKRECPCTPSPR